MDIQLLYWHWLVIGLCLVVAEIFVPSFTILWFGLGALLVGVLAMFLPMSVSVQILIWTVFSVLFAVAWFKFIKPKMASGKQNDQSRAAALGEFGMVTKLPAGDSLGIIRFSTPILDRDEWEFICDVSVNLGDRLSIKEISGDKLVVTRND
ncbi:MAG: NfeD family protein [Porticoccaceae bacterium]|nr:NfeD family protein [Porticoccaceae bacterium]MDG1474653.1 NfeD family protein [Porticoccaceae bacterium]